MICLPNGKSLSIHKMKNYKLFYPARVGAIALKNHIVITLCILIISILKNR
jgi:hypothetical protein